MKFFNPTKKNALVRFCLVFFNSLGVDFCIASSSASTARYRPLSILQFNQLVPLSLEKEK